jgi:virulence-associated protein VagC
MVAIFGIYHPVSDSVKKAKLFMNGRSQAVRLPREFRMPGDEVLIERRGDEVILRPVEDDHPDMSRVKTLGDLAKFFQEHGGVSEEFERAIREARKRDRDWPERIPSW